MKMLFVRGLRWLAQRQLDQFHPVVIAVTGSVGKTTTKSAVAIALGAQLDVRTAKKNYNNEFGVPLAVLGESSPGKNLWEWAKLFHRQLVVKTFPTHLVLEFGADKPGDIQALCDFVKPHVAVLTAISPVHVSNYPNFGALAEEKATLGDNVAVDGLVVLNVDDSTLKLMQGRFAAPTVTYGRMGKQAKITDIYVKIINDNAVMTKAQIDVEGEIVNLELKNCLGDAPVSACAAALLVAHHFDVSLNDAAKALNEGFVPAPGRMRPLAGIKNTLILDDTYNAAPASVMAGLDVLKLFTVGRPDMRRIAVLGKMAELGQYSESEHVTVGRRVADVADIFVATGLEMADAANEAERAGMKKGSVIRVNDAVEAGRWLDANVHEGDIVFVKGSQSARMEKAVKDIIADPLKVSELLVRQEAYWEAV